MTDKIPTACPDQWRADLAAFRAAKTALDNHDHKADPAGIDALFDMCAEAEDKLLGQRAPDIDAVADKLMILFDEEVWQEDEEGSQLRIMIGDLRGLARQVRGEVLGE